MIKNEEQFSTYVINLEEKLKVLGLPLHEHQALIALRIPEFQEVIIEKLQEGFYLIDVVRVYLSQAVSILEVAARFAIGKKEQQKRCTVLVTFKSTDYSLVSIAKDYANLEIQALTGVTLLPMAMIAPKKNEYVGRSADMGLYEDISKRREEYLRNLFIVNDEKEIKLYGNTNSPTGVPSHTGTPENSPYSTSNGPGIPPSQDTQIDTKTDDNMDTVTDTNDDRNFM
ncbi:hypothetical protein P4310_17405 [Bacillus thuringiensis]|uniref:hypothetical protein n=1 Tax=Bacillus thuringiensis TaxID=1428 RepID=UPI000A397305|nr:hypothetical protein [Bacillus thuringiensis]EKS7845859.1 hypothetical protein [Bacillus cereus]MED3067315.1 hypothetical protein [Bacillus thuringiensis]OUB38273.1 hypothetical protein BK737_00410 [Bacillus thuringiensis serovar palmanyolensis]HDR4543717.1 hypothetical protein [Bacillus cereus]HDR4845765.1 hypothetical protein [Bacillus cereus]